MCLLSNNIYDYFFVSQGKVTIPNVDDAEELLLTDVSHTDPPKSITHSELKIKSKFRILNQSSDW